MHGEVAVARAQSQAMQMRHGLRKDLLHIYPVAFLYISTRC